MMMMVVVVALTKMAYRYCPACFHPLIEEQLMSRSNATHNGSSSGSSRRRSSGSPVFEGKGGQWLSIEGTEGC